MAAKKKAKPDPSQVQHSWDVKFLPDLHPGGCLNRHISEHKKGDPCSHRWQAYVKAEPDQTRYDWPAGVPKARGKTKEDWSFSGPGNFQESSKKPWKHESHHCVPNSTLRGAIGNVNAEDENAFILTVIIRQGLLLEEYNLNDKVNMIILPLFPKASEVLGLPRHRKTKKYRNHSAYSKYVKDELKDVFSPMQLKQDHNGPPPDYVDCREKIEALSDHLYKAILGSTARSLDEMKIPKLA